MRSHFAGGELPARVSVVGVGLMGSQIAQLFALNGIQTSIADVSEEAAKAGRERALRLASAYETQGLFEAGARRP